MVELRSARDQSFPMTAEGGGAAARPAVLRWGVAPTPFDARAFVRDHGVVLASARGPVPSLAEAVAGEPIRGSWWAHPRSHEIFAALASLDDDADVACCKLVDGKVTFVHRRLWPALVRLADDLGPERLGFVREEHTATGAHRTVVTPFPDWVPADAVAAAGELAADAAREALGPWVDRPRPARPARQRAKEAR
jgi:hypothetical protein